MSSGLLRARLRVGLIAIVYLIDFTPSALLWQSLYPIVVIDRAFLQVRTPLLSPSTAAVLACEHCLHCKPQRRHAFLAVVMATTSM